MRSNDRPKILFVVNEASILDNEIFYRQVDRNQRDDISYYLMGDLEGRGQQKSSFTAEKTHVYMRYTNYGNEGAYLDLRISSK